MLNVARRIDCNRKAMGADVLMILGSILDHEHVYCHPDALVNFRYDDDSITVSHAASMRNAHYAWARTWWARRHRLPRSWSVFDYMRLVHDRHFLGGDVDKGVVDAEAEKRRHQVLHGRDPGAVVLEHGRHRGVGHVGGARRDRRVAGQVRPAEDDAGVDRRRAQGHGHLGARVQAHAGGPDDTLEGALLDHFANFIRCLAIAPVGAGQAGRRATR